MSGALLAGEKLLKRDMSANESPVSPQQFVRQRTSTCSSPTGISVVADW